MKQLARLISLTLILTLLCSCRLTAAPDESEAGQSVSAEPTAEAVPAEAGVMPLTVAVSDLGGMPSPFSAVTAGDADAVSMTQLNLLTCDRSGAVIYDATEGETIPYDGTDYTYTGPADIDVTVNADGTASYRIRIRDDLRFSDGRGVNIDDLIFTYYVFLDPSYTGSSTLASYPILGLRDYQTRTPAALYEKYASAFDEAYNGGAYGEDDRGAEVREAVRQAWIDSVQGIVDYCLAYFMSYAETYTGFTTESIEASEGLQVMFGMIMWNFASLNDERKLVGSVSGKTWDLKESFPTVEDFYDECRAAYAGDAEAYWSIEVGRGTDVVSAAKNALIARWSAEDPAYTGPVTAVSGIRRLDDYSLEITVSEYSAADVYALCGIDIAPMHHYGDEALYDYENGSYGFSFGDVSPVLTKTDSLGAGPYRIVESTGRTITFVANEYYWKGAPLTETVIFTELNGEDMLSALAEGTADIAMMSGSRASLEELSELTSSGGISVTAVDCLGYGYLGLNADRMNVGGDPGSEASKNLRRAFATLFSAYRDAAIGEYFGDAAYVIDYPMTAASWASPDRNGEEYRAAYSTGPEGAALFSADTSTEERCRLALSAATGYFKAAGYTWDEQQGKFTKAPEGAKLSYEAIFPGDGMNDHPAFRILSDAASALESIGITLSVSDVADSAMLLARLNVGSQEIWAGAWESSWDPDMVQVYHSSGIPGRGGAGSNYYAIDDSRLDALLLEARRGSDRDSRASAYGACMDLILDWAVELPLYQRQDILAVGEKRVDPNSLTPGLSPYWPWLSDIEKLKLRQEK